MGPEQYNLNATLAPLLEADAGMSKENISFKGFYSDEDDIMETFLHKVAVEYTI